MLRSARTRTRTRTRTLAVASLAAAALTLGACSSDDTPGASPSTTAPADHGGPDRDGTTSTQDDTAHNEADTAFARGMLPHHEQAIEMSDILLAKPDADPAVRDLAQQIKDAQGPEIATLRGWLEQWDADDTDDAGAGTGQDDTHHADTGQDHSDDGTDSAAPGNDDGHTGHDMAGMMSPEDLDALRAADGPTASRMYLEQMIEHHEGAVDMARTEIGTGENTAAIDMAHSIVASQQAEIDRMRGMLGS